MNQSALHTLQPYEGIIRFVVAMLAANYFWKFTVLGDEHGYGAVTWFGMDLTWYFNQMADHIAGVVYTMLSWFDSTVTLTDGNHLRFVSTGIGTSIVWGCTGIKQSFIWLCLLLTTPRGWLHKTWFIPFGWLCIYLFNVVRIATIALLIEFHPTWFHFLHEYLFKYLFYIMLFALWVWFTEKVRKSEQTDPSEL